MLNEGLQVSLALLGVGLLLSLHPTLRLGAMLFSLAASVRYLVWRAGDTLVLDGLPFMHPDGGLGWNLRWAPDTVLSLLLLLAETYAIVILVGGYFQTAFRKRREPVPIDGLAEDAPWVDVFVPSYNEATDILRRTLIGCAGIAYRNKRVHLLDDTRVGDDDHPGRPDVLALHRRLRAEREQLVAELGVEHITRDVHRGAKAGNINHALAQTTGALVAVFDADHVPVESFLAETVGFFEDERVALVQTPHHFFNPDPFERNLRLEGRTPPEQTMFYHLIQRGNDFWNSAFFCGSCAVLRREALVEVGGIATETVTEDAHTALKLHALGWHSVYIDTPLAAGLATESFAAHIAQRTRWAIGMTQILRRDPPLLRRGLSIAQRFNYSIAALHFLFGIPRLIYLAAPAGYLLFGLRPVWAGAGEIIAYALPHLALSLVVSSAANGRTRHSFWPEVYETAIAWVSAWATTWALVRRDFKFVVTDKGLSRDQAHFDRHSATPLLVLLALNLAAVGAAPFWLLRAPAEWATVAVAVVWTVFNLTLLSASLFVAYEQPERRGTVRLRASMEAAIGPGDGAPEVLARVVDVSEGGAQLELDEAGSLPDRVELTLYGFRGPVRVSGRVLPSIARDTTLVRVAFDAPDNATRRALLELMFSDPDRWRRPETPEDGLLSAAWSVLTTPIRVLGGKVLGAPAAVGEPPGERDPLPRRIGLTGVALAAFALAAVGVVGANGDETNPSPAEVRAARTLDLRSQLAYLAAEGWAAAAPGGGGELDAGWRRRVAAVIREAREQADTIDGAPALEAVGTELYESGERLGRPGADQAILRSAFLRLRHEAGNRVATPVTNAGVSPK